MEFTIKQTNPGETVLIFSGQLNFMIRKDFQAAIKDVQTEETQQVILDLTNVSFIDCAAIGILVRAKHELAQAHITLSLIAAPGRVFNVLQTMNLGQMFSMVPAKQEAWSENLAPQLHILEILVPDTF